MKKIYLLLLVLVTMFAGCKEDREVEFTTFEIVDEKFTSSYTSVDLNCKVRCAATIKKLYLQYDTVTDFSTYQEVELVENEKTEGYSVKIDDLLDNTTYYVRYVAVNSYSQVMSEEVSEFKTLQATIPTIEVREITDVLDTIATVGLVLKFDGGADITKMGICWSMDSVPTIEDNNLVCDIDVEKGGFNDNSWLLNISGLKSNTIYYVCAYAENKMGIDYSDSKSFITLTLPDVKTGEITDIQSISALLNGEALFDGNDSTTIYGFCWGEGSNPMLEDNHIQVKEENFSYKLSNLKSKTTYYVRAFAKNKIGVVYGEEISFRTLEDKYIISVYSNDDSRGSVSGGGLFVEGSQVTLIATANLGYKFKDWNDGNTENPRVITVMKDDIYTAYFYENKYTISVYSNDDSRGSASGGGIYKEGTQITLIATANLGYKFKKWNDGNIENPRVITVMKDDIYTAHFEENKYTISVYSNDNLRGSVSGGGAYKEGSQVILTATASLGYKFKEWNDGNTDNPRVITVTKDAIYTAHFEAEKNLNAGHEYVDLGLSVKWATCNVGATSPEDYGDYFAWGEVEPKEFYVWSNYKYSIGETQMLKYSPRIDHNTELDIDDDVAIVNWGDSWRIPTYEELMELRTNCVWRWINKNGIEGYCIIGKNGNSIFLPAAGYKYEDNLESAGWEGYYWASSLYISYPNSAYALYFDSDYVSWYDNHRCYGQSIRPVCK